MVTVHPQFITDAAGQQMVVLPVNEFRSIMEELEEMEDIRAYNEAKKEDDGYRISFDDYLKQRKEKSE